MDSAEWFYSMKAKTERNITCLLLSGKVFLNNFSWLFGQEQALVEEPFFAEQHVKHATKFDVLQVKIVRVMVKVEQIRKSKVQS